MPARIRDSAPEATELECLNRLLTTVFEGTGFLTERWNYLSPKWGLQVIQSAIQETGQRNGLIPGEYFSLLTPEPEFWSQLDQLLTRRALRHYAPPFDAALVTSLYLDSHSEALQELAIYSALETKIYAWIKDLNQDSEDYTAYLEAFQQTKFQTNETQGDSLKNILGIFLNSCQKTATRVAHKSLWKEWCAK